MIDLLSVANLTAWSLQVLCVAAAGAAVPSLLRLHAPGVRYAYWRALLAVCFLLPLVQPRHIVRFAGTAARTVGVTLDGGSTQDPGMMSPLVQVNWITVLFAALVLGAALRMAWIGAGLLRLRRLRRAGDAAECTGEHEELQRLIGTNAEIRYVPDIRQPVTFGLRPAVVLLPDVVRSQPPEVRRAVLAHELFHVQRRDWAWVLFEEFVRAIFWFHPGVWWIVSAVQAAREEVVDELALLVARRRSTYVKALLVFADRTPLAPAPAFARRRHLLRRITLISKEEPMSSKRIVASCAVMALIVLAGAWYSTAAFPLQQAVAAAVSSSVQDTKLGPLEQQAKPITPENPIPRRVSFTAAEYPPEEAATLSVRGTVTVRVTLDDIGRVAEARLFGLSLRGGADGTPGAFNLSFSNVSTSDIEEFVGRAQGAMSDPTAAKNAIAALIRSATDAVRRWRYDAPSQAPISFNVTIRFGPKTETNAAGAVSPMPPPPPPAPEFSEAALRVGGNINSPLKIADVKPVYPPDAQAAGVQGVVIIEARIDEEGKVSNARVLRSIPLLDQAALDAVYQWRFVPTLLNGNPVPVVMTVTVNFTLQ